LVRPGEDGSATRSDTTSVRRRRILLLRDSYPEPPALDTAVSHATLELVSQGEMPETLRLHRPAPIVAFGPRDLVEPGVTEALAAARARGFAAVERLAGGRAAVFHQGTLAFSWAIPDPSPREGIRARFDLVAEIFAEALRTLGIDARVGEVPGEYCPGEHSVNARGRVKLVGVGQRVIAGAAHVGGVVVVSDAGRVRDVLVPVYAALGLAWDPATAGSVQDEVPGSGWEEVEEAVLDRFRARFDLEEGTLSEAGLARARDLVPRHSLDLPGERRSAP
jgi:octanoyl-[GcvH]:protein N-octanoyltransferase